MLRVVALTALSLAATGAALGQSPRSGEQIVNQQCTKCHAAGAEGAPKIGDREAWIPRMTKGLNTVVASAIRGHGNMPARGGMADLTDPELRSAVLYMFNYGLPAPAVAKASAAAHDPYIKVIDGTEIHIGLVAADAIRARVKAGDPEHTMHGGIPSGRGYYHVNVSLHDSLTKQPIKDATVQASVANLLAAETKELKTMIVNKSVSYGNYFRMLSNDPYTITLKIRRNGLPEPIETRFDFRR